MPRLRQVAAAATLLALALGLRLWGLGWLPSAAGDEGNWTLLARGIVEGRTVALPADAAFVTLLYAHIMAASMKLLGFTFFAARLPNALAGTATAAAAYYLLSRLGSRPAGAAAAALLAVHPWSIAYSRICSVPYALALLTMTVGPLLFVLGVLRKKPWPAAAGIMVTGVGIHFSPLCATAALACAVFVLPSARRWVFRSWPLYLAAGLTLSHAWLVVPGALRASANADYNAFSRMAWRLWNYVHMVGTGLAGEATLRHFTSHAVPAWPASVLIVPTALLVAAAGFRSRNLLAGFAPLYFVVALLALPLILGVGRDWHLPYNHSDRYLFALLPAFAFCLAEVVAVPSRSRRLLGGIVGLWIVLATARMADAYLLRSGADHGEFIFDGGGGYRGWLVSDRPENTLIQIREHLLRETGKTRAVLLSTDRVFIPMEFVLAGTGIPSADVRRAPIPSGFERYFALLWPDSVLSVGDPPTAPPRYVAGNQRLRQRVERIFRRRQLVRGFVQRDGAPLLELWLLEEPGPGMAAVD
jgi:4-amino-4-deoxy-L-arabinose transferase-like glycosyltransferase